MKVWSLAAMCQNQWQENSFLVKNPNFKMKVFTDEKDYNFTWDYINQKNWEKVREKEIIAFWFKKDTLYINARGYTFI